MEKQPKKYLTKYLPVEGEIKEGDWYKDREGIIRQRGVKNTNHYDSYYSPLEKVKLFLCSRDIQVGDDFWYRNRDTWHIAQYRTPYYDQYDEKFKVIGEISPEATWVTEGMEFDEDEWELWMDGYNSGWSKIAKYMQVESPTHIRLKGPCGHFH